MVLLFYRFMVSGLVPGDLLVKAWGCLLQIQDLGP